MGNSLPAEILMGMETELAFSAWRSGDETGFSRSDVRLPITRELFALAQERIRSLPDGQPPGLFFENGSRFYLDCGDHPEFCTPECRSPAEVVRWQLAGERILATLTAELEKRHPDLSLLLCRCNVDYSGTGETWGCHESYQYRSSPEALADQLIPHLASRLIYTGAGGLNNRGSRYEFLLSPRVPHLRSDVQTSRSPERGIYNSKNEPLSAGGFNRLHVVCGESLSSELSNYLKMGTTALIVRMVDAGIRPGDGLALDSPLEAMRCFARDPSCTAAAALEDGRRIRASELQLSYLEVAERHLDSDFMPDWAPDLCRWWRWVLEQLEADPQRLATHLDWTIKRALFEDRVRRSGVDRSAIARGSALFAELCEIDYRFGDLSDRGLFRVLDAADALGHRLPDLGSIEDAMSTPPSGGRAAARGRAIRRLHPDRARYVCDWDSIVDQHEHRILNMSDPFCRSPRWRKAHPRRSRLLDHDGLESVLSRQVSTGIRLYQDLRLDEGIAALSRAVRESRRLSRPRQEAEARFWCATAHHEAGDLVGAKAVIEPAIAEIAPLEGLDIACQLWTRHASILLELPGSMAEIEESIQNARSSSQATRGNAGRSRVTMIEGRLLGARGDDAGAIEKLERALRERASDRIPFAAVSYWRWLFRYTLRSGSTSDARPILDRWKAAASGGDLAPYAAIHLVCSESDLARSEQRTGDAMDHAESAVAQTIRASRGRCRVEAICTFVESALMGGEFDRVGPFLAEMAALDDIDFRDLRIRMHLAMGRYHCASSRQLELLSPTEGSARSHRERFTSACRAAMADARVLDRNFETAHRVREAAAELRAMR